MNPIAWTASLIKNGLNLSQATPAGGQVLASPKSCQWNGKFYHHGSEVMAGAMIRHCVDGEWQERVNPFITVGP
jgi:hypothetical protein